MENGVTVEIKDAPGSAIITYKHRGADQVKTRMWPDDGCAAAKAAPLQ